MPAQGLVELELVVSDWTNRLPPGDVLVVVAGTASSWSPDLQYGLDSRTMGRFEVGVPGKFTVYPDGAVGAEIMVTFVMTTEMISGSDMSMTHVEIYDDEILVWGDAIPGFEQLFDR